MVSQSMASPRDCLIFYTSCRAIERQPFGKGLVLPAIWQASLPTRITLIATFGLPIGEDEIARFPNDGFLVVERILGDREIEARPGGYIYRRYQRTDDPRLDESFFPLVWSRSG